MYKAFVIDDDYAAIEGVYNSFDWKRLKIEDVVLINTPHNVTDRIKEEKPNVVFIDIEMGELSGLDIIEQAKKEGSDAIFVIVSGHNDFDYARKAIELGAAYYLLKPITTFDVEKVTEIILDASKRFKREDISESVDSGVMCLMEKDTFRQYIKGISPSTQNIRFIVALSQLRIIDDMLMLLSGALISYLKIGVDKYLFIINSREISENTELMLENLAKVKQVCMGMSDEVKGDEYKFYKQACELAYGYFIYQKWAFYKSGNYPMNSVYKLIENIAKLIEKKNIEKCSLAIRKAPEYFTLNNLNIRHAVELYNAVVLKINAFNYSEVDTEYFSLIGVDELISEYDDIYSMCEELGMIVSEILSNNYTNIRSNETARMVKKIIDYINKNYNKKISLELLSKEFYVSVSYLCVILKKITGKTFVDYLTGIRMEKAKEMLRESDLSIIKVAEQVGYVDYFYFNKLFKKYEGITPYQYKKSKEKEKNED